MSDDADDFMNKAMDELKEKGFVMVPDFFIDQLIKTLHLNVSTINLMAAIATAQRHGLTTEMKDLSIRIADIAFCVEAVRDEHQY